MRIDSIVPIYHLLQIETYTNIFSCCIEISNNCVLQVITYTTIL